MDKEWESEVQMIYALISQNLAKVLILESTMFQITQELDELRELGTPAGSELKHYIRKSMEIAERMIRDGQEIALKMNEPVIVARMTELGRLKWELGLKLREEIMTHNLKLAEWADVC